LQAQIDKGIAELEAAIGKKFGDKTNPLLVSVRSGAPVSMPGMMDTILNLGLNDETVAGLIASTGNANALLTTATAVLFRCMATSFWA
jgi:pyruvate,orthophosphate dikinase